jgi:hypothetical protein
MTITVPDFPWLRPEPTNMGVYLKNRLPQKYLPSLTTRFERFSGKRPIISHVKPFRSKYSVISERTSVPLELKNLPHAREAINFGYRSSPKVF